MILHAFDVAKNVRLLFAIIKKFESFRRFEGLGGLGSWARCLRLRVHPPPDLGAFRPPRVWSRVSCPCFGYCDAASDVFKGVYYLQTLHRDVQAGLCCRRGFITDAEGVVLMA